MRILAILGVLFVFANAVEAEEREITDCEICGGKVYQTPKSYVSGNTKYIYIDEPPHKRYCLRCQRDINTGKIDPDDPPNLMPRDDEEHGENPHDNPYAVGEFDWEKKGKPEKDAHTKEAESGFGALAWVIGIVVAVVLLLRFFLKS